MWHYNELYHHGILGQKWGVRRFQNEDGTLTEEGKKRYSSGDISYSRGHDGRPRNESPSAKRRVDLGVSKKVTDTASDAFKKAAKKFDDDISSRPKVVNVNLSNMTDQELRAMVQRASLEQQYKNYYGKKDVKKGEIYVRQVLDTAGDVLAVAGSALAIAIAIKGLKKND